MIIFPFTNFTSRSSLPGSGQAARRGVAFILPCFLGDAPRKYPIQKALPWYKLYQLPGKFRVRKLQTTYNGLFRDFWKLLYKYAWFTLSFFYRLPGSGQAARVVIINKSWTLSISLSTFAHFSPKNSFAYGLLASILFWSRRQKLRLSALYIISNSSTLNSHSHTVSPFTIFLLLSIVYHPFHLSHAACVSGVRARFAVPLS